MLDVAGSLASLIGLSIQIYDLLAKRLSSREGERIALFIAMTETTATWKRLHNQYHSILSDVIEIKSYLTAQDGSILPVGRIPESDLRLKFRNSTNILREYRSFRFQTDDALSECKTNMNQDPSSEAAHLRLLNSRLGSKASALVRQIRLNERVAFDCNDEVCSFIDMLQPLMRQGSWSTSERDMVVGQYEFFYDNTQAFVLHCDKVMLSLIDLYQIILDDIIKNAGD